MSANVENPTDLLNNSALTRLKRLSGSSGGINKQVQQSWGFPGGSVVKNPPADAGDRGHVDLIPGSGRSPGEGKGNPLCILAWRIPWTEALNGLLTMGSQRAGHG